MKMNFKTWLEQNSNEYIHPDIAYGLKADPRVKPFIFTGDKIYYNDEDNLADVSRPDTHHGIRKSNEDLINRYNDPKFQDNGDFERDLAANHDLFGRVGPFATDKWNLSSFYQNYVRNPNVLLVSFWGNKPEVFDRLLIPCLEQLQKDGYIDMNRDAISTINHKTLFIRDLPGMRTKEASKDDIEQQKQQLALHLMGAQEKKKELAKRGFTGSPQSPYQIAAKKANLVRPGQSIYALHSDWRVN